MSIYDEDTWFDDGDYDDVDEEWYDDVDEERYEDRPMSIRERLSLWFYYTKAGQLIERFRRWRRRNDEFEIPY